LVVPSQLLKEFHYEVKCTQEFLSTYGRFNIPRFKPFAKLPPKIVGVALGTTSGSLMIET
jgi:hypothetical protein